MFPTLLQLGPLTLHTYTVLLSAGFVFGLVWVWRRAPQEQRLVWFDGALLTLVGGLVGARLFYTFAHGAYYFSHLGDMFNVAEGGLSWPGAVVGAVLAAWAYCVQKRLALAAFIDLAAWPIGVLGALSWGGCWAASCFYGFETDPNTWPAWFTLTAPDLYGLSVPRFPTQMLGLLWSGLALLALWRAGRSWPPGATGAYALSLVALGVFLLTFTRGDPAPLLNGLRLDTVGSALVLVGASVGWGVRVMQKQNLEMRDER